MSEFENNRNQYARRNKANNLLNIALRGDGAIHPAGQSALRGFADLKD